MFAIVHKTTEASGQKICLLGMGNTELQARQAAYDYCNHPASLRDDGGVFDGGHLLVVSERLAELNRAALIGEDEDAHGMLLLAYGRLCMNADGELDYTNLVITPRPAPVVGAETDAWDDFEAYDYV